MLVPLFWSQSLCCGLDLAKLQLLQVLVGASVSSLTSKYKAGVVSVIPEQGM